MRKVEKTNNVIYNFIMTNYVFLGFLALWVIGMIIAFIIGMQGDIKNTKDTSPLNMRYVKNQFIFGVIEIIAGTIVLIINGFPGSGYVAVGCFASGATFMLGAWNQLYRGKKKANHIDKPDRPDEK